MSQPLPPNTITIQQAHKDSGFIVTSNDRGRPEILVFKQLDDVIAAIREYYKE